MSDTKTDDQPVAEPTEGDGVTPKPAAADAQGNDSNLDDYLAQFNDAVSPPSAPSTPELTPADTPAATRQDLDQVIDYVRQSKERELNQRVEKAVADSVALFKETSGTSIPDDLIEAHLYRTGDKNPAFAKAFGARDQNPQAWKGAISALAKDFAKTHGGEPAPGVDASRAAVRDAQRTNVQTAAPESSEEYDKRVAAMTPAEFDKHLKDDVGYKGGTATIGG